MCLFWFCAWKIFLLLKREKNRIGEKLLVCFRLEFTLSLCLCAHWWDRLGSFWLSSEQGLKCQAVSFDSSAHILLGCTPRRKQSVVVVISNIWTFNIMFMQLCSHLLHSPSCKCSDSSTMFPFRLCLNKVMDAECSHLLVLCCCGVCFWADWIQLWWTEIRWSGEDITPLHKSSSAVCLGLSPCYMMECSSMGFDACGYIRGQKASFKPCFYTAASGVPQQWSHHYRSLTGLFSCQQSRGLRCRTRSLFLCATCPFCF